MQHGGWPESAAPRMGRIDVAGEEVHVRVLIDYTEHCPQGCNAYPRRFEETAVAKLTIDRHGGHSVMSGDAFG